jgi:hypothetical protein
MNYLLNTFQIKKGSKVSNKNIIFYFIIVVLILFLKEKIIKNYWKNRDFSIKIIPVQG